MLHHQVTLNEYFYMLNAQIIEEKILLNFLNVDQISRNYFQAIVVSENGRQRSRVNSAKGYLKIGLKQILKKKTDTSRILADFLADVFRDELLDL